MTDRLTFSDGEGENMTQDKQLTEMEDRELAEAMIRSANDSSQGSSSSISSQSTSSGSMSGIASIPETSIQRIVDLGFTRDQAILELQRTNGNVEVASAALIAKSLSFPPQTR